jgi:hypothetical protein
VKAIAFAINLGLVAYLVWSKRLFGVRGGGEAFERERRGESLLEVEAAALRGNLSQRDVPGAPAAS